ncbi:hypothetical protein ABFS83_03G132400 [Erythranthe nasuta]
MEELFQYMQTLRSQINDVADQAAEISVEEHMQTTTIQTLQNDLDLVRNEIRQVKEESDKMTKTKGHIYLQILEKQRKITSLESDSSTLSRTLELMQQEVLGLSGKLVDRRYNVDHVSRRHEILCNGIFDSVNSTYYKKIAEDISGQLKEQQEWIKSRNFSSRTKKGMVGEKADETKGFQDNMGPTMMMNFQAAQANFDKIGQLKSNLVVQNSKLRESVELVKTKMTDFKPELREMDEESLAKELQELLSDKTRQAEYVQSLQLQIMRLKEISHEIRCSCGEKYHVRLDI